LERLDVNPAGLLTHEYVLPATAATPIVEQVPVQIVEGDPSFASGSGLTVTTTPEEAVTLQPNEFVSVSVYVVVAVGHTCGFAWVEVNPVGLLTHEYVLFALAATPTVEQDPLQIVDGLPSLGVGTGFTVTFVLAVAVQLLVVVSVTVKVVVDVGATVIDAVVIPLPSPSRPVLVAQR
jgi:hypothetical protein